MRHLPGQAMAVIATILGLQATPVPTSGREAGPADSITCRTGSTAMARVELFFGAGGATHRAWSAFLARVVTPRFPDGFTSLDGIGQ